MSFIHFGSTTPHRVHTAQELALFFIGSFNSNFEVNYISFGSLFISD
jgi:hypothetical protein